MHRLAATVLLQYQNARSFAIVGIVFHYGSISDGCQYISGKYPVGGQFIVPVIRDTNLPDLNQTNNPLKSVTHGDSRVLNY